MARSAGTVETREHSRPIARDARTIRVLIAEDHLIARLGVTAIINAQQDMAVVAEASNGRQAIERYRECRPNVVLMDMLMPVMNGTEAVSAIRGEFPEARILALSTYDGDEDIHRAFNAGVQAYLTKDVLHTELIRAIRTVDSGKRYVSPRIAAVLAAQTPRPDLSSRELEVLRLIVQGESNKRIAWMLNIAEHTVKNHVKSILSKLDAGDRTQAATAAIRRGIIHLEHESA
jgi:DNA-binding NarL/FixJ family response regulator